MLCVGNSSVVKIYIIRPNLNDTRIYTDILLFPQVSTFTTNNQRRASLRVAYVDTCLRWHMLTLTYAYVDICLRWHMLTLTYAYVDICLRWHMLTLTYTNVDICLRWHMLTLTYAYVDIFIVPYHRFFKYTATIFFFCLIISYPKISQSYRTNLRHTIPSRHAGGVVGVTVKVWSEEVDGEGENEVEGFMHPSSSDPSEQSLFPSHTLKRVKRKD